MNKIKNILIGGREYVDISDRLIPLASDVNRNTISIICGRNRTGKTHILKHSYRAALKFDASLVKGKKGIDNAEEGDIRIYVTDSSAKLGLPLFFGEMDRLLSIPRSISLKTDSSFLRAVPKDETRILHFLKKALYEFSIEHLNLILSAHYPKLGIVQWNDYDKTLTALNQIDNNLIYLLDQNHLVVKEIQRVTNGKLYLGVVTIDGKEPIITLNLSHDGTDSFTFGRWSDGQKVFFITLLMIYYHKPSIVFFDEIENHLHPEYITLLLQFIKSHVGQTIITTHHPHLIFSRLADNVTYLETVPSKSDALTLNRSHRRDTKPVLRKVLRLDKNYAKLLSAYKLFDSYDDQLIRLSSSVLSNLNETIAEAFTKMYTYDVLPSTAGKKFDLQTDKLFKLLIEKKKVDKVTNILDFGAGKGRLLLNLNEIDSEFITGKCSWTLFEPAEKTRAELIANIKEHSFEDKVRVIGELGKVDKYDLIIIANVLHELPPPVLSQIFSDSCGALADDGELIIVEIYPLVLPEKFSLPLKSDEWLELMRLLKWKGIKDNTIFKYADFEASWVQLNKTSETLIDKKIILSLIKKFWQKILKDRCQDYAGRKSLGAIENSMKVMCELTSIASISSYLNGEW
jgi:AAA15 family ATPase/GTPase/SAM-dependent methyltransferase